MFRKFEESYPIAKKLAVFIYVQAMAIAACGTIATLIRPLDLPEVPVGLFCAGILLASFLIGLRMRKAIVYPYVSTVERMERLAAGDLKSDIAYVHYSDCVGRMTKAMLDFKTAAQAKQQAEAALLSSHDQAFVVDALAEALKLLASGQVTVRLNEPFAGNYDRLRVDFNTAVKQLNDTLGQVANTVGTITSHTGELSTASDDLSRRTEQQAASLEQTAAALDEITVTVRKTADSAAQARSTVGIAKTDAERGDVVAREAVEAMNVIENSSRQIGDIIGVIDEIAFQTNLLALNAGVEAARAGDAGRGFAVVASEVRALAQRSAEAAKQIKTLISASRRQVETGVGCVGQTGTALQRIITQVNELADVVVQIAASAHEQATGLAEINTAINQMDQVTQQNAAMVEQSTAATRSLTEEAQHLSSLIGTFKIADAQMQSPRPRVSTSKSAVSRLAAKAPARKLVHVTAEDWTEF